MGKIKESYRVVDGWVLDEEGLTVGSIPSIDVIKNHDLVKLEVWINGEIFTAKSFKSKEEVDSFIDELKKSRDEVFQN